MRKSIRTISFAFLSVGLTLVAQAQVRIALEKARVSFTSDAELEMIRAYSDHVKGMIDPATNRFAFIVPLQSFKGFNNALQREHFNEKYMESEKYPTASFTGKIIEQIDYTKDGVYEVRAKGDLEIHGQKQVRIIKCRLVIKGGLITVESDFLVPLADHNISVPRIITRKISKEIKVNFRGSMIQRS